MDSVAVVFRLSVSHADVKRIAYFGIWVQGPRTPKSLEWASRYMLVTVEIRREGTDLTRGPGVPLVAGLGVINYNVCLQCRQTL